MLLNEVKLKWSEFNNSRHSVSTHSTVRTMTGERRVDLPFPSEKVVRDPDCEEGFLNCLWPSSVTGEKDMNTDQGRERKRTLKVNRSIAGISESLLQGWNVDFWKT